MRRGQTLLDVAVTESGSVESAWDIALQNGMSLTDTVSKTLNITGVPIDSDTVVELAAKGSIPATDGEPGRDRYTPIGRLTIGKDKIE